jgi:uncharacterized protein (TIGR02444 family)
VAAPTPRAYGQPTILADQLQLDNDLWRFASGFYEADNVAAACLTLQEKAGVDVDVLLLAIFAQLELGIGLGVDDFVAADDLIRDWRGEVVRVLRQLRMRLKSGPAPAPNFVTGKLRDRIKASELLAEQIELSMLETFLSTLPPSRTRSLPADAPGVPLRVARYFAEAAGIALDEPELGHALGVLDRAIRECAIRRQD